MRTSVTTIERFILDQEKAFPEATGELSNLLYDVALATKLIAAAIRRAGLVDVLGSAQNRNVQGEDQQKLDVLANETIKESLKFTGRVCVMGSEEDDEMIPIPSQYQPGKYVVLFDPLDGSSNIDVNAAVGTIFSVYRRVSKEGRGTADDLLQPGYHQVVAGYVMYGSSTMLVYTTGDGVHGFTLDPTIGEFLLSHPRIVTPSVGKYYSVNESNFGRWDPGIQTAVRGFHGELPEFIKGKNCRYIGSLVADFHRNLIAGGIFMYPADTTNPNGKLRLLYECAPMAFIAEQAGGAATDGEHRILDIVPASLHERTPLVIGSREDVKYVSDTIARVRNSALAAVGRPDRRRSDG
jgi:fructose-1,6-bisphosphatase I